MLMCKVAYWILVVTHNPSKALTLQTILLGRTTASIVKPLVQHWSSDDHRSHSYFLIKLAKLWWACWVGSESGEVGGASVCKDMKLFSVVLMQWFKTSYSAKYLNFTSLLLKYILFVLVMHPNPCILRDSSSGKFRWTSVLLDRDVMDDLLNAALLCSDMRLKTLYLSENHFLCIMRPDVLTEQASAPNREQLSENNFSHWGGKEQRKQDFKILWRYKYFSIRIKPGPGRTGAVVTVASATSSGLTKTHFDVCRSLKLGSHWLIVANSGQWQNKQ